MKKIIILLISLLLSGCYNYKELSELSIVSAFAIDKNSDEYSLYVQIVNVSENGENSASKSPISVVKSSGKTIFEAARNLNKSVSKVLFNSNLEFVLLSDKVISNNLEEVLDYLSRDTHLPFNFLIVTSNDNLYDVLSTMSQFNINSSTNLSNIIKLSSERVGNTYKLDFNSLLNNHLSHLKATLYPSIKLVGSSTSIDEFKSSEFNSYIESDGLVFFKDGKTIKLSSNEEKGFNIISSNIKNGIFTFQCDQDYFTIELLSNNISLSVNKSIDIDSNIEAKLVSYNCPYDLKNIENIKKLEKISKNQITSYINETINLAKKYNSDFIGIRDYLFKNNSNYNIDLSKISSKVNVNVNIIKEGNLRGDIS